MFKTSCDDCSAFDLDLVQHEQGCPLCIELSLFSFSTSYQLYHIHLVDPFICFLRSVLTDHGLLRTEIHVHLFSRQSHEQEPLIRRETNILHADFC
jgi:hypothetical protein